MKKVLLAGAENLVFSNWETERCDPQDDRQLVRATRGADPAVLWIQQPERFRFSTFNSIRDVGISIVLDGRRVNSFAPLRQHVGAADVVLVEVSLSAHETDMLARYTHAKIMRVMEGFDPSVVAADASILRNKGSIPPCCRNIDRLG